MDRRSGAVEPRVIRGPSTAMLRWRGDVIARDTKVRCGQRLRRAQTQNGRLGSEGAPWALALRPRPLAPAPLDQSDTPRPHTRFGLSGRQPTQARREWLVAHVATVPGTALRTAVRRRLRTFARNALKHRSSTGGAIVANRCDPCAEWAVGSSTTTCQSCASWRTLGC